MENLKKLSRNELFHKLFNFEFIKRSPKNVQLIRRVYDLVCKLHKDESDRPDGPYINHLLRVAILCLEFGANDINVIVAALLHRSAEDQADQLNTQPINFLNSGDPIRSGALMEIGIMFGPVVEKHVTILTEPDLSFAVEGEVKQKIYSEHISNLIKADSRAALIKLADFYDKSISLNEIKDNILRKQLCKRYKPIFEIFMSAVCNQKIAFLDIKKIQRIMKELNHGYAFVKNELKK